MWLLIYPGTVLWPQNEPRHGVDQSKLTVEDSPKSEELMGQIKARILEEN